MEAGFYFGMPFFPSATSIAQDGGQVGFLVCSYLSELCQDTVV